MTSNEDGHKVQILVRSLLRIRAFRLNDMSRSSTSSKVRRTNAMATTSQHTTTDTQSDEPEEDDRREMFFCTEASCSKVFMSRSGRDRHVKTKHRTYAKILCRHGCGKDYMENNNPLRFHERTCDRNPDGAGHVGAGITQQHHHNATTSSSSSISDAAPMELTHSSHGGNFRLYRSELAAKTNIEERLRQAITHEGREAIQQEQNNIKFTFTVKCIFEKALRPGVFTDPPAFFKTSPVATTQASAIDEILQGMFEDVWEQIKNYVRNGSGWALREVINVDMQVCQYVLLSLLLLLLYKTSSNTNFTFCDTHTHE